MLLHRVQPLMQTQESGRHLLGAQSIRQGLFVAMAGHWQGLMGTQPREPLGKTWLASFWLSGTIRNCGVLGRNVLERTDLVLISLIRIRRRRNRWRDRRLLAQSGEAEF